MDKPRHTIAMPSRPSCPQGDEVRVWHTDIRVLAADRSAAHASVAELSTTERERYTRYRADADRMMFIGGRLMARALVASALAVAPGAWQWREGPHGRPEIGAPSTPLRFNLAHSAGLVVFALANGRDVGVDVEDLDRTAIDERLVRRYCAPAEIADIESYGGDWRRRFLIYWTLKEAYLKARGLGISVPLSEISFSVEPSPRISFLGSLEGTSTDWAFQLIAPTPRHIVAVAAEGPSMRVTTDAWTPPAR